MHSTLKDDPLYKNKGDLKMKTLCLYVYVQSFWKSIKQFHKHFFCIAIMTCENYLKNTSTILWLLYGIANIQFCSSICFVLRESVNVTSAARKFLENFGHLGSKFLKFRPLFNQISGYFGLFLDTISNFLTLPHFFIAFLCDNFFQNPKKC